MDYINEDAVKFFLEATLQKPRNASLYKLQSTDTHAIRTFFCEILICFVFTISTAYTAASLRTYINCPSLHFSYMALNIHIDFIQPP